MALKIPLGNLPLPEGKKRWIVLGGIGVAALSIPLVLILLFSGTSDGSNARERFSALIEKIAQQDLETLQEAITDLPRQKDLLQQHPLFEEIVEAFSTAIVTLDGSRDGWVLSKEFWSIALNSGAADVGEFVALALARLRHSGVLIHSREESFPTVEEMTLFADSDPLKEVLFNKELLKGLLTRERPVVLLWDRANTAELATDSQTHTRPSPS